MSSILDDKLAEANPPAEPQVSAAQKVMDDTNAKEAEAAVAAAKGEEREEEVAEPPLPKLSPAEFRKMNYMADHMNQFHEHFRRTWTMLYTACTTNTRPAGLSIRAFLDEGLQFIHHLTMHHNIEETYIFPKLARRMPEFQPQQQKSSSHNKSKSAGTRGGGGGGGGAGELLEQHRQIHKGMDLMEAYLNAVKQKETELDLRVLRDKMDSFGEVLWTHLDQEVVTLGAENMRRYWNADEIRKMAI